LKKENILYKCPICYYRSFDKEEIEKCKSIGKNNRFLLNEEIVFEHNRIPNKRLKGKIVGIIFRKRDHFVKYRILVTDSKAPAYLNNKVIIITEGNVFSFKDKGDK